MAKIQYMKPQQQIEYEATNINKLEYLYICLYEADCISTDWGNELSTWSMYIHWFYTNCPTTPLFSDYLKYNMFFLWE